MCIFQSEHKKCPGFTGNNATEFARFHSDSIPASWPINDNPIIMCGSCVLGCYQKYTTKPSSIAELKTALLSIWNDLPQKFIDKAISSFRKRLRSCVAAAGGHFKHSLNTERAAELKFVAETMKLLTKKLCKV